VIKTSGGGAASVWAAFFPQPKKLNTPAKINAFAKDDRGTILIRGGWITRKHMVRSLFDSIVSRILEKQKLPHSMLSKSAKACLIYDRLSCEKCTGALSIESKAYRRRSVGSFSRRERRAYLNRSVRGESGVPIPLDLIASSPGFAASKLVVSVW